MLALEATRQKLDSMLRLISALRASDFPHEHSRAALTAIEDILLARKRIVDKLGPDSDPGTANTACNDVFGAISDYLPLLGYLQHSKNSSNAFELYGPLLRLSQQLIGEDAKLILASEWAISPFTLVGMAELPSFVWVGLPASESSNALLSPLAGHEFGHLIWERHRLLERYRIDLANRVLDAITANWTAYRKHFPQVTDQEALINDFFGTTSWAPALEWALSQAEEVFCDMVGVRVFGESYLQAFAFLLAPGEGARGTPFYPSLPIRAEYMVRAAEAFGYDPMPEYGSAFQPVSSLEHPVDDFLLRMAEIAVHGVVEQLVEDVLQIAQGSGVPLIAEADVSAIQIALERMTPHESPASLAAILTAGWRAAHDTELWREYPQLAERRNVVLNELLLKNAQVLEFNTRTQQP